jgi:hypothetical protein
MASASIDTTAGAIADAIAEVGVEDKIDFIGMHAPEMVANGRCNTRIGGRAAV